ncbi:hypothetical protein C0J52_26390 [Blattella germanica]|nr:hypothetical protein C0J52_26390 [Blattella germanica]
MAHFSRHNDEFGRKGMTDFMACNRLPELWKTIDQLHLSYLQTDESLDKIEQRAKLEGYIREYLCLVPHDGKFCFRETADVLHQSATIKEDFSGYRAASAWNAIGMYASNLLTQPWRKEYRELKLFCGFYKHEIEANLVGAELMLQAMGYKHTGHTTMVLDGPIDPDRVSSVSRDSLVAFVECQLLKTIWEEVSRRFNCSWLEVLEFRENHIGTPESAAKGLVYSFHHRQYQEQHQHQLAYHPSPMDAYGTTARFHPPGAACMYGQMAPIHTGYYNYSPYNPGHAYTLPQPPRYTGLISPQQALPPVVTYPMPPTMHPAYHHPAVLKSQDLYPTNGHHPHQHYPPQMPVAPLPMQNGYSVPNQPPNAPAPVPTAQLIELDIASPPQNNSTETQKTYPIAKEPVLPARTMHHSHQQTSTMKRNPEPPNHSYNASLQKIENQPLTSGKAKDDGTGTFESWDYVFRNLESQGYSKDLGERPDVLSPSPEHVGVKDLEETLMELRLEEYNKKMGVVDKPLKINEALQKIKMGTDTEHSRVSPSKNSPSVDIVDGSISAYDNMPSPPKEYPERERPVTIAPAPSKPPAPSGHKPTTMTLPRDTSRSERFTSYVPPHYSSATLDPKHLRAYSTSPERTEPPKTRVEERKESIRNPEVEKKAVAPHVSDRDKWECVTCTYHNLPNHDVCEMCGKSKVRGSEVRPLASGGRECPQCTLVNEKGVDSCEACGNSLKDSPTYI